MEIEDILAGYDNEDFAFEVVNDAPDEVKEGPSHSDSTEALTRIEQRLDAIASSLNGATPEYRRDMEALEGLIMPLLVKLSKGDEPYIKWPNRQAQISNQIERILEITRKYVGDLT